MIFETSQTESGLSRRASPGGQDGVQVFPHADVLRDVGTVVT